MSDGALSHEQPEDGGAAPCRLFVYLARDAPVGVVLRRGPSDWARLSVWHTLTDRIEHGQWIRGRVYERRSDVSADGSIFAAFVRQSGHAEPGRDTWVALSHPPFFSALALWYIGGTYHTGAFFPAPDTLWLGFVEPVPPDAGSTPARLRIAHPRDILYVDGTSEWTERTVHFNRLLRDGWRLLEREPFVTTWERRHPRVPRARTGPAEAGHYVLTMRQAFDDFTRFGGPYAVEYVVRREGEPDAPLGRATWGDWDHQGRLVLARDGRLLSWTGVDGLTEIADFNGQTPDPQPAPDWAMRW